MSDEPERHPSDGERRCAYCGRPVERRTPKVARYCNAICRRKANEARGPGLKRPAPKNEEG